MHQLSSIRLSNLSPKRPQLAELIPTIGVMGILIGFLFLSIYAFRLKTINCRTESSQPCTSELLAFLKESGNSRMLLSNQKWLPRLESFGYSPDPLHIVYDLPNTLNVTVQEQSPSYQIAIGNDRVSINAAGYIIPSSQVLEQPFLFTISDPNLALQIASARSIPVNLHSYILTTIQKIDSLSINFLSLNLLSDNSLLIELSPELWAYTYISDPSSFDRLQQIMSSNQLSLEEGQSYEIDTRFSHPVLRKRL